MTMPAKARLRCWWPMGTASARRVCGRYATWIGPRPDGLRDIPLCGIHRRACMAWHYLDKSLVRPLP